MQKETGEKLASQLNLGEVLTWRLHWLTCDIRKLQEQVNDANFGQGPADLSKGIFADFVDALQGYARNYARLRWEAMTMLGCDYQDEVEPLFANLAKHAEYIQQLDIAKGLLEKKAQYILEAEASRVQGRLNDLVETR